MDGNAYPAERIIDGWENWYLGIPFINAMNATRVEVASYVGTGLCGANNPCSLTFSFPPKIVMLIGKADTADNTFSSFDLYSSSGSYNIIAFVDRMATEYTKRQGFGYFYTSSHYGKRSEDGKTISWYYSDSSVDAKFQYNSQNTEYFALAIG
jgi:hypothetical protein